MNTDGGLLAATDGYKTDSAELRNLWRKARVYQVFDLLYLDGRSLLNVPLESRKQLLQSVLRAADTRVRFADHVIGKGLAFLDAARNTVIYTVAVNAIMLLGGLTAALLTTREFRGRGIVRTLLLMPWIVPTYVVGFLWGFMWQPDTGPTA